MANPAPKTSRQVALEVLNEFNVASHSAGEILHDKIRQTDNRAHATDLVFGVIRNRSVIDMLIEKIAAVPVGRIRNNLLSILRLGTYELVFSPKTTDYAIVNEAVNLAGYIAGKKQTGFVNAVLRSVSRTIAGRSVSIVDADPKTTLPQSPQTGCRFNIELLPHPKTDPAAYFSRAFSLPKWLVTDWLSEFDFEQTRQICFAANRAPGIFLRPNTLKTSAKALAHRFAISGIEYDIDPAETTLRLRTHRLISELPGFDEGLFTVQDPASAAAVRLLAPGPGWTVIDLCAAPGGKTCQMAQAMDNIGRIIATDINSERLKMVGQNCKRLGITIVQPVPYGQLDGIISRIDRCDAVLLDVPCSNTGVLARRPEVRLRVKPEAVVALVRTQMHLLEKAAKMIQPASKICYSTCSILNRENSDLVRRFLSSSPGFHLESEDLILPSAAENTSFDHDGAYTAILTKQRL